MDTSLKYVTLPQGVMLDSGQNEVGCFSRTKLTRINLNGCTIIPAYCLNKTYVQEVIGLENVIDIDGGQTFGMERVILPNIRAISGLFNNEDIVKYVELGELLERIRGWSMCHKAKSIEAFVIKATTPPVLENETMPFGYTSFPIFVPDESVNAYKSATNWARLASRFKPISEYVE